MTKEAPAQRQDPPGRHTLFGVPEGYDSVFLAELARKTPRPVLHVSSDDLRFEQLLQGLRFFAPDVEVLLFPAWDCLPYDRVSPTSAVSGERLRTLSRLLHPVPGRPLVVLSTISAAVQRVPPRAALQDAVFAARAGGRVDMARMQIFLAANGYHRTETVREAGEFAVRGGLVDIFPSGAPEPLRIDTFGDEIESIRAFDPLSQRTTGPRDGFELYPVSEVLLNDDAIRTFRTKYRDAFGAVRDEDPLYAAVSAGQKYAGAEHWLPYYYPHLETLFDYMPGAVVTLDHQTEQARLSRLQQVADLYQARRSIMQSEQKNAAVYRPVPVETLFLPQGEWHGKLAAHEVIDLSPFAATPGQEDAGARKGRDFGDIRAQNGAELYNIVRAHVETLQAGGRQVIIACYSEGARDRLKHILEEHGLRFSLSPRTSRVGEGQGEGGGSGSAGARSDGTTLSPQPSPTTRFAGGGEGVSVAVLGLEHGFETKDLAVITEQDILGDRLARIAKKKRKSDAFVFEISQMNEGDYVVHEEHGVGQFLSLETVVAGGIPHDCLKILYAGGDKLFVPVENLDVLSRYGAAESGAVLDRLGGAAWQARRARVKRDLLALAQELLKIAAARVLRETEPIHPLSSYEKFCAGFPYPETEDQHKSITDVIADLERGQAMDRLICGDVGFGKTEVALRAAALAALSGHQVAMIAPTTLLARQHYQTFLKRFHGFPVRIGLLSRFVTGREAEQVRAGVEKGDVHILIGTHALLSEKIHFRDLALLIVDEEQKFGVKQKERLKQIRENVHVLTLTATPIPRTLQMALTGVRELSVIATAPVDRLAVKTFVLPRDPVVLRDALMREHYRGGQTFYVCPRISDLEELEEGLKALVPELKVVVAHGQMGAEEMEEKMSAFYEGAFDILLSTNIVESGLDIPNANTMVIHRAEMFGLAQLYQLRGRIGRGKQRAYAYLTFDPHKKLTKSAEQRLRAIEQLDTLGAGFQLASHDLDIRGAGNLLGEEQSGHIKEIGVELYQQMLEEAVAEAKGAGGAERPAETWSPVINLGMPVLIPEDYIPDLNLRLSIYRRIAALDGREEIEGFAAELVDRFGPLPKDVENLLDLVEIKQLCRLAGVAKADAGPKGAVIALHPAAKINIQKLVQYISKQAGTVKLRPEDQRIVFMKAWDELPLRLKGLQKILKELITLV